MLKSGDTSQSKETSFPDTIDAIKANNAVVLKQLYIENYPKIEHFVLKNSGTKEQAKDLYQEAFIVFWRNIRCDKFKNTSQSSIVGYLYTIAKYKWIDHLRSNKTKTASLNHHPLPETSSSDEESVDDKMEKERLIDKAMTAFKNLEQPCKSLLTKFYFEKKSMKDIAGWLQMDAASVRNKKYRCMQKLREIALKGE